MKQSIKFFIESKPACKVVTVAPLKVRGAKPNSCFLNSLKVSSLKPKYDLQSGWLVGDYFDGHGTAFIAHYWVKERESNLHFDPTPKNPIDKQCYEYILDLDIFSNSKPNHYMPASFILLPNNDFKVNLKDESVVLTDIPSMNFLYGK